MSCNGSVQLFGGPFPFFQWRDDWMTPTPKQVMLIGNMMNHDARMEFGEPNSQEKTTTWANEISPAQASAHATCELCTRGSIMSGAGTGGIVQSDFSTSMICHDMSRFSSYPSVIPHLLENEQVFHWQIGKSFIKKQFAIMDVFNYQRLLLVLPKVVLN